MALGDSVPTAGDVLRVTFRISLRNQIATPGLHYKVVSKTGAGDTLNGIAATIATTIAGAMPPLLPPQAVWDLVMVRNITRNPIAPGEYSPGASAGTDGDYPLPSQSSGIVTVRTAMAGRAFRGRFYMPFPSQASADSVSLGEPNAAYLASLTTLMGALLTSLTSGTSPDQVVISPVVFHSASSTYDDVVDFRVNAKWATQRRRGDYGRPNSLP